MFNNFLFIKKGIILLLGDNIKLLHTIPNVKHIITWNGIHRRNQQSCPLNTIWLENYLAKKYVIVALFEKSIS